MDVSTFTRVQKKIHLLADVWNSNVKSDKVASFEKDVDEWIAGFSSCNSSHLVQSSDKPVNPNQKIDHQARFFSTKKKNVFKKTIAKPTQNERKSLVLGFKDINQTTLNVHTENDHSYCDY